MLWWRFFIATDQTDDPHHKRDKKSGEHASKNNTQHRKGET